MSKIKTITCLSLALVTSTAMFSACGGGEKNKGTTGTNGQIQVSAVELGYGLDWLQNLAEGFTAKTGIGVTITSELGTDGADAIQTKLESGKLDADLVFSNKQDVFAREIYKTGVKLNGVNYDKMFVDVTDVWTAVEEGTGKTIKEKMNPQHEEFFNYDNHYYGLPWAGGAVGIVRNKTLWASLGYDANYAPLTTDELFTVCDEIVAKYKDASTINRIYPFTYSGDAEYYSDFINLYFAQYDGIDAFNRFKEGLPPEESDGIMYEGYDVYQYQGQYEVAEFITRLIVGKGYQDEQSVTQDFSDMQDRFISGKAALCINGSWLAVETGNVSANIDFIKAPVISSITDKFAATSDKTDAKLREIVQYIDGGETGVAPTGVTSEDIALVRSARKNSYATGGVDHQMYIPCYSNDVDKAKQFMKFIYSDEGLKTYYDTMDGLKLPATPTVGYTAKENLTTFNQSVADLLAENYLCTTKAKSKMFTVAGVSPIYRNGTSVNSVIEFINTQHQANKTVAEICQEIMTKNQENIQSKWTDIATKI